MSRGRRMSHDGTVSGHNCVATPSSVSRRRSHTPDHEFASLQKRYGKRNNTCK
jgi:hypothetical protein